MSEASTAEMTKRYLSLHKALIAFSEAMMDSLKEGIDHHRNKIRKVVVLKIIYTLDEFIALDGVLRSKNGDNCPGCGGEHIPYHQKADLHALRKFAIQASEEEIRCDYCLDMQWMHVFPNECSQPTKLSDAHIEPCCESTNFRKAVADHDKDCGCTMFRNSCRVVLEEQRSLTLTPQLESNEMADLAKSTSTGNATVVDQKAAFKNVGLRYTGETELPIITLPDGMEIDTGIDWLKKIKNEQDKQISIDHAFPGYYPTDAALALHRAIVDTYGFASQEGIPTFFSVIPPATIGIQASLDTIVQIPWGRMTFHGVSGYVETQIKFVDGMPVLRLAGLIRKGDADKIENLVYKTKENLQQRSIYRGQAVIVDFSNFNPDDPRFEPLKAPQFMDLKKVSMSDLILPKDVYEMVNTNLFVPIIHTEACRRAQIPLRRGILLAGPFGTGKTLTAQVTAKLANEHKWTYIYITNLKQLPEALAFANNYAPAVIFGEDIDRVLDGDRDEEMDEYLNSMDGVNRKHHEVLVVFTTNELNNIHPAMMRPGRIDAIIPIDPPDADAAMQLLRKYGRGLIAPDADLSEVGHSLAGQIPAVLREVVERSKLRAIRDTVAGESPLVTAVHLMQAAMEMLKHVKYINPEAEDANNPMQVLGEAIGEQIGQAVSDAAARRNNVVIDLISKGNMKEAFEALVTESTKSLTNGERVDD